MYLQRDLRNYGLAKARTIFSKRSCEECYLCPETAQLTGYHWKKIPNSKADWFWNL